MTGINISTLPRPLSRTFISVHNLYDRLHRVTLDAPRLPDFEFDGSWYPNAYVRGTWDKPFISYTLGLPFFIIDLADALASLPELWDPLIRKWDKLEPLDDFSCVTANDLDQSKDYSHLLNIDYNACRQWDEYQSPMDEYWIADPRPPEFRLGINRTSDPYQLYYRKMLSNMLAFRMLLIIQSHEISHCTREHMNMLMSVIGGPVALSEFHAAGQGVTITNYKQRLLRSACELDADSTAIIEHIICAMDFCSKEGKYYQEPFSTCTQVMINIVSAIAIFGSLSPRKGCLKNRINSEYPDAWVRMDNIVITCSQLIVLLDHECQQDICRSVQITNKFITEAFGMPSQRIPHSRETKYWNEITDAFHVLGLKHPAIELAKQIKESANSIFREE